MSYRKLMNMVFKKALGSPEDYLAKNRDTMNLDLPLWDAFSSLSDFKKSLQGLLDAEKSAASTSAPVPDANLNQAAAAGSELAAPKKVDADVTAAVNPIFKTLNQAYAANKYKVEEQQNQLDTGLSTRGEYGGQVS